MVSKITLTEEEIDAMDEKAENPDADVKCPRCGESLVFSASGSSYEVVCPTDGCIHLTSRGL